MPEHYLPRVSRDTMQRIGEDFVRNITQYEELMREENPELYAFIDHVVSGHVSERRAAVLAYMSLRRQAEANQLGKKSSP